MSLSIPRYYRSFTGAGDGLGPSAPMIVYNQRVSLASHSQSAKGVLALQAQVRIDIIST